MRPAGPTVGPVIPQPLPDEPPALRSRRPRQGRAARPSGRQALAYARPIPVCAPDLTAGLDAWGELVAGHGPEPHAFRSGSRRWCITGDSSIQENHSMKLLVGTAQLAVGPSPMATAPSPIACSSRRGEIFASPLGLGGSAWRRRTGDGCPPENRQRVDRPGIVADGDRAAAYGGDSTWDSSWRPGG